MDPKPRPNRGRYMEVLRKMTPEQRLLKAFELSTFACDLLRAGLRDRYPELGEAELHALYLARRAACHNRNY